MFVSEDVTLFFLDAEAHVGAFEYLLRVRTYLERLESFEFLPRGYCRRLSVCIGMGLRLRGELLSRMWGFG